MKSFNTSMLYLFVVAVLVVGGSGNAWSNSPERGIVPCWSQTDTSHADGNRPLIETSEIRLAQTCTADCLAKYRDCLNRGGGGSNCWDDLQECLKGCK